MPTLYHALPLVLGILILFFGRRLFWLFVAGVGFVVGSEYAPYLVQNQPEVVMLSVAICLGFAGALLALFLEQIAIALAGFVAGGYLAVICAHDFLGQYLKSPETIWIAYLVGGVLGAILLMRFFGWALIFLSSGLGAEMIIRHAHLPSSIRGWHRWLMIVLFVMGVIVQSSISKGVAKRAK